MMGNLSRDVQKGLPLKSILYHLCKYTAEAAYADTFQLYLVESNVRRQYLAIKYNEMIHMFDRILVPCICGRRAEKTGQT